MRSDVSVIIPAAGRGSRLKHRLPKALVPLCKVPLFVWTVRKLRDAHKFNQWIVPIRARDRATFMRLAERYRLKGLEFVVGGKTRAESVQKGLKALSPQGIVLVHDMARPFVNPHDIQNLIRKVRRNGACILAQTSQATVKRVGPSLAVQATLDRRRIYLAQTPQGFQVALLKRAYQRLGKRALRMTDESSVVEAARGRVRVVEGSHYNLKITTPEDLKLAEQLIKQKLV